MADSTTLIEQRLRDTLDRRLKPIEDELKDHHKTLYGNGVPGWDEMLRTLYADYLARKEAEKQAAEEAKKETKEEKRDRREEWQKYLYFGVTLVIGGTVGGLIDVFVNHIFGH